MGKGVAKYGFKSGILPVARSILKNPTIKQTAKVQEASAPTLKGIKGTGYAENISQPAGSSRYPPKIKFIDVEELIKKTVPEPSNPVSPKSPEQEAKALKAKLRREYLSDALRQEEARLLKQEALLRKKQQLLKKERQQQLKEANAQRSSDLTIPTLESLIKEPLMRHRTPEEEKLVALKRKHNREMQEFMTQERRLVDLVSLYHASSEFIVTEDQLLRKVDEVFASDNINAIRKKLNVNINRNSSNDRSIVDALYGSLGNGEHEGLPIIQDFLSSDITQVANDSTPSSNVA